MALFEISNLKAGYVRVPILHQIDMQVEQGEFVGLLGHNGMGKSTLMRAVMGYVKTTGGSIQFHGQNIHRLPTYQRARLGISLVPQGREIFPNLTVMENLTMGLMGANGSKDRINDMLDLFPRLHDLVDRQGGALSGGEQQILALARCLCNHPTLVLLDEPTEGVQPSIIQEISDALHQLRVSEGLTIILVEQNLEFIAGLASRIYTISNGITDGELPNHGGEAKAQIGAYLGFAE